MESCTTGEKIGAVTNMALSLVESMMLGIMRYPNNFVNFRLHSAGASSLLLCSGYNPFLTTEPPAGRTQKSTMTTECSETGSYGLDLAMPAQNPRQHQHQATQ